MDFMEFLQAGWEMDLNMIVIQKKKTGAYAPVNIKGQRL
jgi:hypothetical protein